MKIASTPPIWRTVRLMTVVLLMAQAASADIIQFKDGTRMRGTIVKRTSTDVTVKLEFGMVSFAPHEIVAVEPEELSESPQPVRQDTSSPPFPQPPVPPLDRLSVEPSAPPIEPRGASADSYDGIALPEAMKAVALVASTTEDGGVGFGSGSIINRKGVILTNYHVIAGANEVKVILPNRESKISLASAKAYEARVLKTDPCYDLALIQVPLRTPVSLRFAEDGDIHVGGEVRAIGNPEGLMVSVSKGIISAVRTVKEMGMEEDVEEIAIECRHLSNRVLGGYTLIQTDASINPGNSGGPLLNGRNEIVGVNTLMVGQGLNFAIHVKHARTFAGSYVKE